MAFATIAGVNITFLIKKKKRLLLLAFPLLIKSSFLKTPKEQQTISYNVLIPFPHSSYLDGMLQCMSIKNIRWSHQRYHQCFKFAGKFWFQVIYEILMQNKQYCNEQWTGWMRVCKPEDSADTPESTRDRALFVLIGTWTETNKAEEKETWNILWFFFFPNIEIL